MDKKAVYFLSNYHDPFETTTVNRKQKDGSSKTVCCPVMCSDYNKHMGYVDNADRLLSTYKIDRKSKKWWHRVFWHFLDLTIVNSFILYKNKDSQPSVTLKKFRLLLADQLVGHKIVVSRGRKRQAAVVSSQKPQVSIDRRRSQASHMPKHIESQRRCALCSTKFNQNRTSWICSICDVPLCLFPNRNCFITYHS